VARRCVTGLIVGVGPIGIFLYLGLPQTVHAALQVFNGAYTIPAVAAIWIYAFVYLFLVPSREAAFRSVESVERSESLIRTLIEKELPGYWEKDVKPVLATWQKLGERLEARLDAATLERLLKGVEVAIEVSAPMPALPVAPDGRRGLGAFNHRPVAVPQKEEKP